ncbi:hypothetical protein [uncultured Sphingomonas sp.]|uniref:hypothetical protein n=1 Tax=uncultured Sphingomonas sp. TaxID=158754 RepID=UPI0035CA4674
MTSGYVKAAPPGAPDIAGLEPIARLKSRWPAYLGIVLTIAMVALLSYKLFGSGFEALADKFPTDPRYYIAFALLYLSLPTGDFVIFQKLWSIPIGGLAALIKKRIANETLVTYAGETYFYTWARTHAKMVTAPFGAVKDVSILSAIAGNAMTMALIALALPFGHALLTAAQLRTVLGSIAIVFAMSLPFLLLSKKVFSLPRRTLWWIFMIHCLRLTAGSVLIAFAWHFALPGVSIAIWLFLAAARLLVSRLPLVPNKDLLFANFAIFVIGPDAPLSDLMAFTAGLTLVVHIVLIAIFSLYGVVRKRL